MNEPMRLFRRTDGRRSRGQSIVELALILPLMLLLLATAADLGRLFHSKIIVSNAARAGALEGARHPTSYVPNGPCDANVNRIMCAVSTESTGSLMNITPTVVSVVCDPNPCSEALGSYVRVTVNGQFTLITPILGAVFGGPTINLTSTATAQVAVRPNIATSSTSTPTPTPTPSIFCPPPIADFRFNPGSGRKKRTDFNFTDLSTTTAGCPLTWSWNFGDGAGASSTSTLQNPTHQYQSQGTFTITLVVSNPGGSDSHSDTVTVTP